MNLLDKTKNRLSGLFDRFSNKDSIEIHGLINATGAGGSKSRGEVLWNLIFTLENWKYPNARELQNTKLMISKTVTENQLSEYQEAIDPYTVYRLKVKMLENNTNIPQANLVKIAGKSSDQQLLELAKELQKPLTFKDDTFGVFTLDRSVDWFEIQTTWNNTSIRLTLSIDEENDETAPLAAAKKLWTDQEAWSKKIINFSVEQLLDLKNNAWLDEGETELSKAEFTEKMKLEAINIYPDGEFSFWYNDGNLFWGHSIQISGSLTEGPTDADIPG